jgi:hypothetical protein
VLNLEAAYDARSLQQEDPDYVSPPYPSRLPRSTAWLSWLSGAMGQSYGCYGVWNWGMPVSWLGSMWDFQTAVSQPSFTHSMHLAEFMSGVDWWRLEPRHDLIKNQSGDWLRKMVLAKSANSDLAVAYLPDNDAIAVEMSAFPAPMAAKWFNPATGEYKDISNGIANSGIRTFTRPASGDWVLRLTFRKDEKP